MDKNNSPLISIIVVTYNSAKYVLETLESAKLQSYKNIELIVTDDCSTDDTINICENWIQNNRKYFVNVELISNEINTGIAANCNRGILKTKGEWLKFIAGDDILLENCISDNLLFIKNNPDAKFITSEIQYIDHQSKIIEYRSSQYEGYKKKYFKNSAKEQLRLYARLPMFLNSPAFFIRRRTIIDVGCFDENYRIYDDMCLIYRTNGSDIKVNHFDLFTVKYRIHDNAISRSTNCMIEDIRKNEQILIFKKYRKIHLNKLNLIDLSVYYEIWLNYKFKGIFGHKASNILHRLSFLHWYLKYLNFKL